MFVNFLALDRSTGSAFDGMENRPKNAVFSRRFDDETARVVHTTNTKRFKVRQGVQHTDNYSVDDQAK